MKTKNVMKHKTHLVVDDDYTTEELNLPAAKDFDDIYAVDGYFVFEKGREVRVAFKKKKG